MPYRDPVRELRSARERHGQNEVMPGMRRYDLSQREHLPAVPYYSQPHRCCAGRACRTVCDCRLVRSLSALLVNSEAMISSPGVWMTPANLDATQCKMARAALGIGVRELAARAVVSPDTVSRLEKGERLHQRTVIAIREAMEAAGVEFLPDGGVRLRPAR